MGGLLPFFEELPALFPNHMQKFTCPPAVYKGYCSLPMLVLPAICKQGVSCCYHVSICCHLYSWWWPFWLKWAMRWNLEVVLVCVALMVKEAERFSKCFIGTCFYCKKFLYLFYVYVYAYVYVYICMFIYMFTYFMYKFMHIFMYICLCICLLFYVCFSAYIFVHQVCPWCLRRLEGIRFTVSQVTNGYELPQECWEINPCLLQEQQVILIAEPSLQP